MLYSGPGGATYGDTFFNRTLELAEPAGGFDAATALTTVAAFGGVAALFVVLLAPPKTSAKKPAASGAAAGAAASKAPADAAIANEWLQGTSAWKGKKADKPKGKGKKH